MKVMLVLVCVLLLFAAGGIHADTWYVKPDSTGEVINLQAGIDSCASGDTVLAAFGVYQGDGNRDLIVDSKAIVLISELGPDTTVIDCEGSSGTPHWAFNLQTIAGEGCMLNGFSITGCFGYGIRCDSSIVTISNMDYYQNNDDVGGSALSVMECSYSNIDLISNRFTGNNGRAVESSYSNLHIDDCLFSGHTTQAVHCLEFMSGSRIVMRNSQIVDNVDTDWNEGGAGIFVSSSYFEMDSCTASNNNGSWGPAFRFYSGSDTLIIKDSEIINNNCDAYNINFSGSNIFIQGSNISNNYNWNSGCIFFSYNSNVHISNSLIANNEGGVQLDVAAKLSILNTTIYGNSVWYQDYDTAVDIANSIVAFNGVGLLVLTSQSCCDVYESDVAFYPPAALDSLPSNISADPIFCDPENGIFTLRPDSPCLPGNHPNGCECGLIGAYGLGCPDNEPYLAAMEDIKNDQGGQVSIGWSRSRLDSAGSSQPITHYEVYRRIDDLPTQRYESAADYLIGGLMYPPGDWHYLFDVPAHGEDIYYVVAPTLEDSCVYNDSTIAGEPLYFSTYFVRASTAAPTAYFDSEPDSGYSVDNIAPGVPEGFTVVYNEEAGRQLSWEPCSEADFQYYRVYCGSSEDFAPSQKNLVHTCTETSWLDQGGRGYWNHYYKISTVDHNGNESEAASPNLITADDIPQVPHPFALYQNAPNPFNPTTTIRFDLPRAVHVKLCVYNVAGKLVSVIVDRHMPEGRKEVAWSAHDNNEEALASGIYFYRLVAGDFVQTKKMVLLR